MQTTQRPPNSIPFGRIADLRSRPDAELIALCNPASAFNDLRVKRYASRKALETFLKTPGNWFALVKTPTERNMLLYPAFQTPSN